MQSWPRPDVPRLPGTGYPLRLYDTATASVRQLDLGRQVGVYVCGITPYDATHLGHAATYLGYDVLQRQLLDAGHTVTYVQNVTDVDDPLLERATRDGVDWRELALEQTELFRTDMVALRVLPPAHYIGAVEAIPDIIVLIEQLVDRGATYQLDGDLYFSVAADPHFGDVGHLDAQEMLRRSAVMGGDPDRPGKKHPLDPMLWRAERPGEPAWPSPWGPGRPGWHVECSAIAQQYLGDSFDIQGGGNDLVFPHHECSASHGQVATGISPFARAYAHSGMVAYLGEKMSKSLGNLVLVSQLRAAGVDPVAVRLAVLSAHWRSSWEWTDELLRNAEHQLSQWREALARPADPAAALGLVDSLRERLADDLDSPGALAAVDAWAADSEEAGTTGRPTVEAAELVRSAIDALLGVRVSSPQLAG
jgi:L-cysteine:1D-myo-inositol 2-amino-2-deoxy-alpha-D-glucopyranoside ligase